MTSPFPICPPRFPDEVKGEFSIWKKTKTEQFVFQFQSVKNKKKNSTIWDTGSGRNNIIHDFGGMGVLRVALPHEKST
jgi:hypothetical protein